MFARVPSPRGDPRATGFPRRPAIAGATIPFLPTILRMDKFLASDLL